MLDRLQTLNESVSRQHFIGAVPCSKIIVLWISSTLEISLFSRQDQSAQSMLLLKANTFERAENF